MNRLDGLAPKTAKITRIGEKELARSVKKDVIFIVGPHSDIEKSELVKVAKRNGLNYSLIGDGTSITVQEMELLLRSEGVGPDTHFIVTGHGGLSIRDGTSEHRSLGWKTSTLISALVDAVGGQQDAPPRGAIHLSSCEIASIADQYAPDHPLWTRLPCMLHGGRDDALTHNSIESLSSVLERLGECKREGAPPLASTAMFERIVETCGEEITLLGASSSALRHDPLVHFDDLLQQEKDLRTRLNSTNCDPRTEASRKGSRRKLENIFFYLVNRNDVSRLRAALKSSRDLVKIKGANELTPLHLACDLNLAKAANLLIRRQADVNARNLDGEAPLHRTCYMRFPQLTKLLLTQGADPNQMNHEGRTPLHTACCAGDLESAIWLLKAGTDVNAADKLGRTPLSLACLYGRADIAYLLLTLPSADHNSADRDGDTPLHHACYKRNPGLAAMLASLAKESFLAFNRNGKCPLDIAIENDDANIVEILISNGSAAELNYKYEMNLLHLAIRENRLWLCELLLRYDALDIEKRTSLGETPLHCACAVGASRAVKMLLEAGARVDAADSHGTTPLAAACATGDEAVVQLLIRNGADTQVRDQFGRTLLHHACRRRDGAGLKILARLTISSKRSLDATDELGRTPLMYAAERGDCELVDFLLKCRADESKADNDGKTPSDLVEAALKNALDDRELFAALKWIKKRLADRQRQ